MATNNAINLAGPTPAFSYINNANQTVTTAGGAIVFANKIIDTTNSFDGVSTFTAPVSGLYFFSFALNIYGLTSSDNLRTTLITTSGSYITNFENFVGQQVPVFGTWISAASLICSMSVSDTAYIVLEPSVDTITLNGYTAIAPIKMPIFSGYMIPGI